MSRESQYQKAAAEARRMHARHEKSNQCSDRSTHTWHVLYVGDKANHPCGGGSKVVTTTAVKW